MAGLLNVMFLIVLPAKSRWTKSEYTAHTGVSLSTPQQRPAYHAPPSAVHCASWKWSHWPFWSRSEHAQISWLSSFVVVWLVLSGVPNHIMMPALWAKAL